MNRKFPIMLAVVLSGCAESGAQQQAAAVPSPHIAIPSRQLSDWHMDPVEGSFGTLEVGMPKGQLAALGLPTKWGEVEEEGDLYETATVGMPGDITFDCVLSDGIVHRCTSNSSGVRDRAGMGVGSTLGELRRAYPRGHLIVGAEAGRYANFIAAESLIFSMDLSSIKDECFELKECDFCGEALRVVRIFITRV